MGCSVCTARGKVGLSALFPHAVRSSTLTYFVDTGILLADIVRVPVVLVATVPRH